MTMLAVVLGGVALVIALGALIVSLGTEPLVIHDHTPPRDRRGRFRKRASHDLFGRDI